MTSLSRLGEKRGGKGSEREMWGGRVQAMQAGFRETVERAGAQRRGVLDEGKVDLRDLRVVL